MDTQLIRRIQNRDHDALMELYDRYGGLVKGMAYRVLQDDQLSEEVTQDVFLKVWRQPERWNAKYGRMSTWLMAITRNAAIDRLRYEQRRPNLVSSDTDDIARASGPEHSLDDPLWHEGHHLRQLVGQLPDNERLLIVLAFYRGLTHSELSAQLSLPLGTVKTRLRRGLRRLRDMWRSES